MALRREKLIITCLAIIAIVVIFSFMVINRDGLSGKRMANSAQQTRSGMYDWKKILRDLQKRGKLRPDDFEKIDFSLPGDAAYGDDPENEFFNPAGKFKAIAIPQDLIDKMSKEKGNRVFFNIRRHFDKRGDFEGLPHGTVFERLVYFMPNVKETCIEYKTEGNADVINGFPFKTNPDNHEVVDDGYYFEGCARTPNRESVYSFVVLATRIKLPGSTKWVIY